MYYLTQLDNLRDLHRCTPLITDFVAQQCFKLYPELRIHQANSIKLQKNISNFKYVISVYFIEYMHVLFTDVLNSKPLAVQVILLCRHLFNAPHYTSTAAECIMYLAL